MEWIRQPLYQYNGNLPRIELKVDRLKLSKRRWRSEASDGTEFCFELEKPVSHGDIFFQSAAHLYAIQQESEVLLEVALPLESGKAARLGWSIGNMHFPVEIRTDSIRVMEEPALRLLFEQLQLGCRTVSDVFQPTRFSASASHHPHHVQHE